MSDATRKSLMLETEPYNKVSAFAKEAKVPRPVVIDALLELVDVDKLRRKLQELRAQSRADQAADRQKRQALSKIASDLSMSEIQSLLAKLEKAKSE